MHIYILAVIAIKIKKKIVIINNNVEPETKQTNQVVKTDNIGKTVDEKNKVILLNIAAGITANKSSLRIPSTFSVFHKNFLAACKSNGFSSSCIMCVNA
jgi:hypothetical protein